MPTALLGSVASDHCIGSPDHLTDKLDRPACTECHRRKQKCTRRWPCHHCQKRKIADQCSFIQPPIGNQKLQVTTQKRSCDHYDNPPVDFESDVFHCFEAIGYMQHNPFASGLSVYEKKQKSMSRHYFKTAASCSQLRRALQVLPSRTTTDLIVQNFIAHCNFQSYILYPRSFLEDYCDWWANRQANKALELRWTSLLLAICACSTQHTRDEFRHRLENELGERLDKLSNRYHRTARELHDAVPISCRNITSLQLLMHSCLWYKCKAQFVQAWHTLNISIRLAQELRIDQEKIAGVMSEFDCEMRRRLWCVLDTWDWHISSVLSRSLIIDRLDCDVGHPNLALEDHLISPLLHMKLQSLIFSQLSRRFGTIDRITSPCLIKEHTQMVQEWMGSFPQQLDAYNPDTSLDFEHEWIALHRQSLQCAGYRMMLKPLRPYLSRRMTLQSQKYELQLRDQGVDYALRFLHSLVVFLNHTYIRDATFQVMLFSVFDVSITLCSTIMHDGDGSLNRSDDIFNAILESISVLENLGNVIWTAETLQKAMTHIMLRIAVTRGTNPNSKFLTLFPSDWSRYSKYLLL